MKSLKNKLIIYDSNCKVCSSLKEMVLKLTTIPPSKVVAYKDLDPEMNRNVDPEKFKNVMALIDTSDGHTLYGAEGVAYIFSAQWRVIDLLLGFAPIFNVFNFLYKTQAYNRYIIATPKSKFTCDCYPDRILKYRISYIVLTLLTAVLLTSLFGISLRQFVPGISPGEAAGHMLLIAGTGWVFQIMLAIGILRNRALDYIGHLGSIMVAGLLILLPWIIIQSLTGLLNPWLPALSVLVSSGFMLYLHRHRISYLEISQTWTLSWFLLLQTTAFFWIYFLYLK